MAHTSATQCAFLKRHGGIRIRQLLNYRHSHKINSHQAIQWIMRLQFSMGNVKWNTYLPVLESCFN